MHARCCGIDVHKESVVACLRLQEGDDAGESEVRQFGPTTAELLRLHEWLAHAACTHVGMESTSVYLETVLDLTRGQLRRRVGQRAPHQSGAWPEADIKDCEWIAISSRIVCFIRASFIPPSAIRDLRDLTRHRKSLIRDRVEGDEPRTASCWRRPTSKLANVVADVLGVSGRAMLNALVAGETDPNRLAKLAKGSLTPKVKQLAEALRGQFTSHHAFLLEPDAHAAGPVGGAGREVRCAHP